MKTSELTGCALDWAVAQCEGLVREGYSFNPANRHYTFRPSSDWSQGGPIIERELIDIATKWHNDVGVMSPTWQEKGYAAPSGYHWQATTISDDDCAYWIEGPTPLIAAMRCYVASKLGDEVEVPAELTN